MGPSVVRTGIVLLWVGFTLVTQRWLSWSDGIRLGFATDVQSYEQIARAAPSLPSGHLPLQHAERFPAHWFVGVLADATRLDLQTVYRIVTFLCLSAAMWAVAAAIARLDPPPAAYAVATGVAIASAFPVHFLLAAPGMVADAVFLLGLSITLLGFVRGTFPLVLGGLLLATLGRQTAVPVAVAAAIWVAVSPAWRRRWWLAAATLLVPLATYGAIHEVATRFALPSDGLGTVTVFGATPRALADHVARTALGILVPAAIALGAWLRTRGSIPRGALAVAAAIVAQPLLLAPAWTSHNEPRLAGLAAPALALAVGALLARAQLNRNEALVLCAAICIASLHRLYTHVGVDRAAVWGALAVAAAVVSVAVLSRRPTIRR